MGVPGGQSDSLPNIGGQPAGELLPLVYDQLRAVARQRMALERAGGGGHTLQPTALVHEAFARVARDAQQVWSGQREFFCAVAREMERVLVDHARAKFALKRGGDPMAQGRSRIPLDVLDLAQTADGTEGLALHEAILRLEGEDPQAAAVVRLRFFAGLSAPEVALTLGVSERTVVRDWAFARAYLADHLLSDEDSDHGPERRASHP